MPSIIAIGSRAGVLHDDSLADKPIEITRTMNSVEVSMLLDLKTAFSLESMFLSEHRCRRQFGREVSTLSAVYALLMAVNKR
jgi:hypothetical protein